VTSLGRWDKSSSSSTIAARTPAEPSSIVLLCIARKDFTIGGKSQFTPLAFFRVLRVRKKEEDDISKDQPKTGIERRHA
jgi:hypothetical protein